MEVTKSVFSQVNVPSIISFGFLPKWPYEEVGTYIGLFNFKCSLIPLGDISIKLLRIFSILLSSILPVPWVLTYNESGLETPIAYAIWIVHFEASPEATTFLAKYLVKYAADLSTFVGDGFCILC